MYIIVRNMKVQKGFRDKMIERFLTPGPVQKSPGFIKSELLVETKNPEFDLYRQTIYWQDKKAFYIWEGSPEHIAMHKDPNHAHHQKPAEIIEVTREAFELIASK